LHNSWNASKTSVKNRVGLGNSQAIFRDKAVSAAKLCRPVLDRFRDSIAQAQFDHLFIIAPDRLAHKYLHQMLLLEEFEKYGCQVEFLDRSISKDPNDQLLL
jgi:site-specific DNA recombinase